MIKAATIALQCVAYLGFAAALGILSGAPEYRYADANKAILTLSVSHATQRIKPCVRLTPQQIETQPPNMRQESRCERERVPLLVELTVDDKVMLFESQPSGIWHDGPASVYRKMELEPGPHRITARLRDSRQTDSWDFRDSALLTAISGQYHTVKFRPETGGFQIR